MRIWDGRPVWKRRGSVQWSGRGLSSATWTLQPRPGSDPSDGELGLTRSVVLIRGFPPADAHAQAHHIFDLGGSAVGKTPEYIPMVLDGAGGPLPVPEWH